MKSRRNGIFFKSSIFLLALALTGLSFEARAADKAAAKWARHIVDASRLNGGLVVHVGCQDGQRTAALRINDAYLVQGLTRDAGDLDKARKNVQAGGAYGRVTIDHWSGQSLPYISNLVNILVVDCAFGGGPAEIRRVLAPKGIAVIRKDRNKELLSALADTRDIGMGYAKYVNPWPEDIDEWTHFMRGPDNNQVSNDRKVGPPRRMQWLAAPTWTRHHGPDKGTRPAIRGVISAGGKIFYLVDTATAASLAVPSRWCLVARDGFSGVLLWEKPLAVGSFPARLERLWRSLIADSKYLYTPLAPGKELSQIDAATGETVKSYPATKGTEEVIKAGHVLYAVLEDKHVIAVDAVSGKTLWKWKPANGVDVVPLTLAASGGNVFVKTDDSICGLSGDAGKLLWRFEPKIQGKRKRLKWPREVLIAKDGIVLCSYGGIDPQVLNRDTFKYTGSHPRVDVYNGRLVALSAENGRRLWEAQYKPGLESDPGEIYVIDGLVWLGPDFAEARNLKTGKIKDGREGIIEQVWTHGHHYRCYPGKATVNYAITAKRGIELIDLRGNNHSRNNWIRGTCRIGVTPCNGLIYAPSHSCGCYMEAKLYGFWAVASDDDNYPRQTIGGRLVKGPAYGKVEYSKSARSDESWPTYRHDHTRGAAGRTNVGIDIATKWQRQLNGRITAPVIADGYLVLSEIDKHSVVCLNADTGNRKWSFTTGGRVDSPPTIYKGMVFAGSADGYVYCLRLSDGTLAWKFLAALKKVNAVAFNQIESLWPVHGSVLVKDDTVYALAGRSSYLDGGMVIYGLDPKTGKVKAEKSLRSKHAGATPPPSAVKAKAMVRRHEQNWVDYKSFLSSDKSDSFSMAGSRRGILVADETSIYLRQLRFDKNIKQMDKVDPHLFSTSSLLDGAEIHRSHWAFGTANFWDTPVAYPWIVNRAGRWAAKDGLSVPHGLMLAFDDNKVWAVARAGFTPWGKKGKYLAFSQKKPPASAGKKTLRDFRGGKIETYWVESISIRPRALVKAGDYLFVGGNTDTFNSKEPDAPANAAFRGEREGLLCILSCKDGKTAKTVKLDSCPVWDGIAAANGKLYVSGRNGKIVCLGKQ